ncbi:hypothetical protein GlitD10_2213, partial [Gloeomargarita lithophora Alchichica-D10]
PALQIFFTAWESTIIRVVHWDFFLPVLVPVGVIGASIRSMLQRLAIVCSASKRLNKAVSL